MDREKLAIFFGAADWHIAERGLRQRLASARTVLETLDPIKASEIARKQGEIALLKQLLDDPAAFCCPRD